MNFRKLSDWAGLCLFLWLLFSSRSDLIAVCACALAPLIAMAWAVIQPKTALTQAYGFNVDVELTGFWQAPCLALCMRALIDTNILDWGSALAAGLSVGGIAATLMWRIDQNGDRRSASLILMTICLLAWGWGVVSLANSKLDRTAGVPVLARVVAKASGKYSHLTVQIPEPIQQEMNISPPGGVVNCAQIGSILQLKLRGGLFGWRHVELDYTDSTWNTRSLPLNERAVRKRIS